MTSRSGPSRFVWGRRFTVSLGGGALVTLALVSVIAILNARERVPPADLGRDRAPTVYSLEEIRPSTRPSDSSEAETTERPRTIEKPEGPLMTVDLDVPEPRLTAPRSLSLDLSLPSPEVSIPAIIPPRTPGTNQTLEVTQVKQDGSRQEPVSAGPLEAQRVDEPPRELAGNRQPAYPEREERLGIAGSVKVEVVIDERGRIVAAEALSGSTVFRTEVLRVIRDWRFRPARHEGRAVKVRAVKTIRFKPRGR